ncbi:MAG: hypothetical protein Q7S05_03930 [bacterium]|nr:hypothetical protein [bacterium]
MGDQRTSGNNEAVAGAAAMIYHHFGHFLLLSRFDGTYEGNQLGKGQGEISKLLKEAKNPRLVAKAEELSQVLIGINPGDKTDDNVLDKIGELLDVIRTERKF